MSQWYVGKIEKIIPINGADKIESAVVSCGENQLWTGTVKKGDFKTGDLCYVFLPDTILPEIEQFEFMRKHNFRVRPCKFLRVPSEVLITLPFIKNSINNFILDDILGLKKYEKPLDISLIGECKGNRPFFIPKTDEPNFQSNLLILEEVKDKYCTITLKYDGTSASFYKKDDEVGLCSRNLEKKLGCKDVYNFINKKHQILDKLKNVMCDFVVQGEIVGPKIQGNPLGLSEPEFFVFDVYSLYYNSYYSDNMMREFCKEFKFQPVELISADYFRFETLDNVRKYAEVFYPNGKHAEGVVVRHNFGSFKFKETPSRKSFKILNLNYKH